MKLRIKIIFFFLMATILPAAIVIAYYQTQLTDILLNKNKQYMEVVASEKANYVDEYFSRLESAVFQLKTDTKLIEYFKIVNSDNYQAVESRILTSEVAEKIENLPKTMSFIQSIGILPAKKEGIPILRGIYSGSQINAGQYSVFLSEAGKTPEAILYDLEYVPENNKYVLNVTASSVDRYTDTVVGYVLLQVNIIEFFDVSQKLPNSELTLIVLDGDRKIIALQGAADIPRDGKFSGQPADSLVSPQEIWLNEIEYIAIHKTVVSTDWKLVFLADKSQVTQEIRKTTFLTCALIAVFAVFALAGAVFLYYQFYEPVRLLTRTMQKAEKGMLDLEVPVKGKDEISKLGHTYNHLIREIKRQMQEIEKTQKKKTEMEIRALQAQITPHFLYNTLNSIKSLSRLNRTEDITNMTEALIDLLRLSASKTSLITLTEELRYVHAYTSLMSYRSGCVYRIRETIDDGLGDVVVPKFLLQPIVENSIIHGFSDWDGDEAIIQIDACECDGIVVIHVIDNGGGIHSGKTQEINDCLKEKPMENTLHKFNGIGIHNIKQRLVHEFGPQAGIEIGMASSKGTRVTLTFPRKTC